MKKQWLWGYWSFALAFIALVLFAIPEYIAIVYPDNGPTFSMFMWTLAQKWPLWTFLWGMLVGGLAVHLLWHWSGEPSDKRG